MYNEEGLKKLTARVRKTKSERAVPKLSRLLSPELKCARRKTSSSQKGTRFEPWKI